jgi:aryl sulfotransferase
MNDTTRPAVLRPAQKQVRTWLMDSRRWRWFVPRADDVIIGTSGKCGTTWMQHIVCILIFQSPTPRDVGGLSPWLDMRMFALEDVLDNLEGQTQRRFIKTHLPMDALPIYKGSRYIHVQRDGRDALMSWRNHLTIMEPPAWQMSDQIGVMDPTIGRPAPRPADDMAAFYAAWMTDGAQDSWEDVFPAPFYFDIARTYWAQRAADNLLCVHFNDLKADLDGEMRRISRFLGIEVNEAIWPDLVEAATFASMKRHGAEWLPRMGFAFRGGADGFLHKGVNERWRDALTSDEVAFYEARVAREVSPALARWMANGRLIAGDPETTADDASARAHAMA